MKPFFLYIFSLAVIVGLLPLVIVRCSVKDTGDKISVYDHTSQKVTQMDFEKYVMCVLSAEMPASFEEEALKAQAVAARTYAMQKKLDGYSDQTHKNAHVCTDSTHCQAYRDIGKMERGARRKIKKAVVDTQDLVVTYGGELIRAVFHSAAHGQTENASDVWGGDAAYLKSVPSPWDTDCPDYITTPFFSYEQICKALSLEGKPSIEGIERSSAGGVMQICINGKKFKGTDVRTKLNLRSTCFEAADTGNGFSFTVTGYGHGVGMSQWGANGMAKEGYDFKQILTHYYTGAEISEKTD